MPAAPISLRHDAPAVRSAVRIAACCWLTILLVAWSSEISAQRVQIPNGSPPGTFAPSPTAPAWGAPTTAPSPVTPGATDYGIGGLASPAAAPPPAFDPYSAAPGGSLPYSYAPPAGATPVYPTTPAYGAPPIGASPYDGSAYGAPIGAPSYDPLAPPAPAGFSSEGSAIGWQPGTYGFEQGGTTVRFRRALARLRGEHTLLLGNGDLDSFEVNRLELAATFACPVLGSIDHPLLLTPGFAFNWFEGPIGDPAGMPRGPDLPPQTYDAYLDAAWYPQITPQLGAELGVRTGVWTDFEEVDGDSVRVLGRGIGVVTISPQFDVLLGVVYLDRVRVKLLPAGGIRWRPSPEWDLYLVFPNPKIRRKIPSAIGADWWWYVGGEYGGGSWTLDRAGLGDRIDYNDIRLVAGLEWQTPTQARGHMEIGYVFDREVIFGETMTPPEFKPHDAVMFRVGVGF